MQNRYPNCRCQTALKSPLLVNFGGQSIDRTPLFLGHATESLPEFGLQGNTGAMAAKCQ